jgi:hypothetical protein
MNIIRDIYLEKTAGKLNKEFLDRTLKRDILLSSSGVKSILKCINTLIIPQRIYIESLISL